jgi:putative copper resistance protein D
MSEGMADTALILIRFVHFTTAMLLCGASLFPLYAGVGPLQKRAWRAGLAWAALLSWLAWLAVDTVAISGDPQAWDSMATIGKVLHHTEFGHIWQWRVGILAALAGFAGLRGNRIVMPLAVLSIATLAGIGHGAMGIGNGVWVHLGNQAIHILSASVWVGGLMALLQVIRQQPETVSCALGRFSLMGMGTVLLIVATGLVNAWFLVGSAHALLHTAYGHVLMVKVSFFLGMIGLALFNRLIMMPRLARGTRTGTSLRLLFRSVAVEQALAILVVASVSILGTLGRILIN